MNKQDIYDKIIAANQGYMASADSGCITVSSTGDCSTLEPTTAYTIDPKYWCISDDISTAEPSTQEDIKKALDWYKIATEPYYDPEWGWKCETPIKNNKKGDDDMRYLYEVILVNPKNDEFFVDKFVAKTETSALMQAYDEYFNLGKPLDKIEFDDLKTSCRVLMEWKKEKSLKKAIETIKEAVE